MKLMSKFQGQAPDYKNLKYEDSESQGQALRTTPLSLTVLFNCYLTTTTCNYKRACRNY